MHHSTLFLVLLSTISLSLAFRLPPTSILALNNHTLPNLHRLTTDEIYPATCLRLPSPPLPGLQPTICELAVAVICEKITTAAPVRLVRDKWIWVDLPGCATGYYLPEHAEVPAEDECEVEIFGSIWRKCAEDSRWNAGAINVDVVPSAQGPGTAKEGGEGEVRYMMAPERLTPAPA